MFSLVYDQGFLPSERGLQIILFLLSKSNSQNVRISKFKEKVAELCHMVIIHDKIKKTNYN